MDQQLKLWLAPPIIMGLAYIYFRIKMPLPWSWCFLLQGLLLIVTGACGYLFGPEWLFVLLSWVLFGLFLLVPKFLIRLCDRCISSLNPGRLFAYCKFFPFVYWGDMGLFWRDIYLANAYALDGDAVQARASLNKWHDKKLPNVVKIQLDATTTGVNLLLWDWQSVIAEYEAKINTNASISVTLAVQAARAFSEVHNFERAAQCLEACHLAEARIDPQTLAFVLLPVFSMSGQRTYTEKLIAVVKSDRDTSAEFLLLYWQARLEAACGNKELACALFSQSLEKAKNAAEKGQSNFAVWERRISQQIAGLDNQFEPQSFEAVEVSMTRLWRMFAETNFVSAAILPKKAAPAVSLLCFIVVLAYVMSGCVDMVASSWAQPLLNLNVAFGNNVVWLSEKLGTFAFDNFLLDKQAVFHHGQYYRLFTYMFLHGNITHLFLNVVGLYWFGRRAANIFSPRSFVFIFVFTGILAGLAQIILSDIPAVGASGGVLGIFGADFIGIFRLKNRLPQKVRKAELRSMSVLALSQLAMDHFIPKVAGEAHMGGLLAGLLIGCFLPLANDKESS